MKNFVVMTYYQLMHAIAMTIEQEEKSNLFVHVNYLGLKEEFLERIKETDVFNSVVELNQNEFLKPFISELKKTAFMTKSKIDEIGDDIFNEYLEPYFSERFAAADFNDEIYVYNDFQWYYYYIAKHFNNIVGVEDGYKTLKQQLEVHVPKGHHQLTAPFLGKYYPEPLYKYKNIKKIVSSCKFDDIDEYYKKKLEIIDYKELANKNREKFGEKLVYIFNLNNLNIKDNSCLYLAQPLDRALYCDSIDNYLLAKKIINNKVAEGKHVYIKPHPAEKLDYRIMDNNEITVLDKSFPIEVLDYMGVKFSEGITYGSTSVDTLECIEKRKKISIGTEKGFKGIKREIEDIIANEMFVIDVYIKMYDCDMQSICNICSFFGDVGKIKFKLHVLIEKENYVNYVAEFKNNYKDCFSYIKKKMRFNARKILYKKQWRILKNNINLENIEFIESKKIDDIDLEYLNDICKAKGDYVLITNNYSDGILMKNKLIKKINNKMHPIANVVFHNFIKINSKKYIPIDWNLLNSNCILRWENVGLFRNVFCDSMDKANNFHEVRYNLLKKEIRFTKIYNCECFLPIEKYSNFEELKKDIVHVSTDGLYSKDDMYVNYDIQSTFAEYINYLKVLQGFDKSVNFNEEILKFTDKYKFDCYQKNIYINYLDQILRDDLGDKNRRTYLNIDLYEYVSGGLRLLIIFEIVQPMCWIWEKLKIVKQYLANNYAKIKK